MEEWLEVLSQYTLSANLPKSILVEFKGDILGMYKSGYTPQRALDMLIYFNDTLDWEVINEM